MLSPTQAESKIKKALVKELELLTNINSNNMLLDKVINNGAFVIGILFLLCFIIRHLTHSPIVQINFTSSFLYALKKGL